MWTRWRVRRTWITIRIIWCWSRSRTRTRWWFSTIRIGFPRSFSSSHNWWWWTSNRASPTSISTISTSSRSFWRSINRLIYYKEYVLNYNDHKPSSRRRWWSSSSGRTSILLSTNGTISTSISWSFRWSS